MDVENIKIKINNKYILYVFIYILSKIIKFYVTSNNPKLYSDSREPEENNSYLLLICFLSRGDIEKVNDNKNLLQIKLDNNSIYPELNELREIINNNFVNLSLIFNYQSNKKNNFIELKYIIVENEKIYKFQKKIFQKFI